MQRFDSIRPFYDAEVNEAIHSAVNHPMMKALMNFTFPDVDEVWKSQLKKTHSIRDFQCNFIYQAVQKDKRYFFLIFQNPMSLILRNFFRVLFEQLDK